MNQEPYEVRLDELLGRARQLPDWLDPDQRWHEVRELTRKAGGTAEEFVLAGRAAGLYQTPPTDVPD